MLKVMDEIAESGGHSMSKQLDSKDEEVFMTAKDANSLIMEESDLNLSSQHARTTRKRDNPVLGDVQAAVNRAGVGGAPGDGVQELGSATDIQNTIEEAIHEVAHMTLAPTTTTTSSTSTSTSTTSTTSYTSTRTTTLTTTMQPTTTTEEPESENERLAEQNALANAIGQVENAEGTLERELEQAKAEQQQLQRSSGHESSILAPVSRGLMSSATHTTTLAENLLKAAKEATQDEGEKQEDTSSFFSAASTFSTSTSDESAASHKEDEHQRMLTTSSTRRRSSTSALLDEDGLELSASTGAEQRHQPLKKSDSFGASRTALVDSLESPSRGSFSSFVAGAFSFLQIGPGGLFSRRNGGHFEDVAASRASSHGGSLGEQLNRQGSSKPKNLDSAVGAGLWDGGDRRGTPGSGSPDREHLPEGRGAALQRENFVDAREYEGDNQPNDVDDQRSYYDQNPRGHQTVYGAHRATPNKARRRRDSAPHAPPTADSRRRHARRHRHDRGDVDFIHGPVMRSRAPPGDFEDGIANTGSSEPSPRWTYGDSHRDSRGYHSRTEDEDHSYRYPDHVVSSSDVDHASQYHGDARRDNEYYDVPPDTRDSHWSGMLPSNLHLRDDAGYRTPVRKTGGHRMFDSGHLNDDESVFEYLPLPNEQLLDPSGFPISSSLYGRGNTYTEDIMLEDHARDRERGASVLAPPPASNVEEDLEKNDYDFDELDGIGGASSTSSTYGRWRHQGDQGGADRFFDDEDLDRSEDFEQKQDEDSKARLSSRNPASEEDRPSDDREALRTNAASGSFIHQQSEDGPEAQSRGRKPQDRSGHSTNEAHEADSMHVSSALGTRTSNERTENQRNPPPSARVMRLELDATALSALADDCLTRLSSQSSSKEKDHDSTKGRHHALTGPHSKIKDAEAGSTLSPSTQAHTSSSTQQKPGSLQHSPTAPHPSPTSFFGATVGEASTTQENDNFHGLSRDSFVAQLEREKRQIEAVATAVTNARRASVGHSYILPPVSFIETGSSITVSPAKEDEDPHAGEKLSSHRADKRTVVDDSVQVASALTGVASAPRGPLVREEENHRTGTPPASTVHMHTHDDRQSVPSRQPLVRRESSQTVKGSGWNDQQGVNFYNKDAHLQNLGGTSPGRLEDDYRYDSRLVEVEQRGNYLGEWPGADPAMSNFERSHLQHGDIVDGAGREGDFEEQPFASLRSRSDVTDAEEEVVSRAPQSSVSQEVVAHEVYHRGADDLDHQQDHRRGVRGEGPRERLSMLPRHGRQTRLITAQNPARASSLQRTSAAQMGSSHDSERQSASVSIGRNSDNLPRVDRGGVYADLSSSAETYQGSSIGTGNYPYGSYTPYGAQQPGMQQPMPPAPYWNPYYGQQPVLGPGATAQAPYGYGYPGYNAPPVAGGANSAGYGFYPPTPGTPQQAGGPYGYPPGGASQIVPGVAATGGGGYQESGYGYGTSVGATPGVYDPASAVTDFAAAINPLIPPGASGGTAGGESFASRYLSSLVLVFLLMAMCYGCYHYAEHLRNESPEGGQHHSSRGNQGTSGSFRDPGREQRGGGSARAGTMGEGNIRHYPTLGGTPAGSGPPMSTGNRFPAQQQQQFQPGYGEQGFQQHSQIPAGGTSSAAAPAMNIMVRSSVSPQAPRPHQLLQEDQMQTSEKQRVGQEQVPAPTHETLNARRDVPVIRMSPSASQGVSPTKVHNATTPTHDDRSYKTTPKSSSENAALSD
ncbi:unnamed protein product [Amoebophrya sp. A25]|nr:unnamed protein product [Amoebophrya sp. A25]|eukprot:GSA25T00018854001.1